MEWENKNNKIKNETLHHALLINMKYIGVGYDKSNKELRELLKTYKNFGNLYESISSKLFEDEYEQKEIKRLEKILNSSTNFKMATIKDEIYPIELNKKDYFTPVIYYQGDISLLNKKTIAIVGTRDVVKTKEFESEVEALIERLVKEDYAIISGLAKGCDTLAHKKTMEYGGRTIAVIGTPLNRFYPKENKYLQQELAKNHLILSQYPIGIKTWQNHFIYRNKTLVGLSKEGVIVLQAKDKSGTQHAIRECIKENKALYVLESNKKINQNENLWEEKYKSNLKTFKI